ncbi:MAG: cytochrome b N-terminal domain-containing protein [Pirellulaceae bacterium]
MQIVLGLSLTGYLLPWDQKGYYATQVTTKIMGATPLIGPQVQQLAQGGPEYGRHTLTRFFAMHAGVLPGLLIAFLALHIYVFRRHGITTVDPDRAPTAPFWPDQVLKDGVACLGILAVVMLLAILKERAERLRIPPKPIRQLDPNGISCSCFDFCGSKRSNITVWPSELCMCLAQSWAF